MKTTRHPMACIIGAGPYGVSIAAYLRSLGVTFRIFGSPMRRWLSQMPEQMLLKSESSCASSLYEPTGTHTLARFCRNEGLPYSDFGEPISRELFAKYALWFQRTLVPDVEDLTVTSVTKTRDGFEVQLSSGEKFHAAQVIVATGLDHMERIPEQLIRLPAELRSHSSDYYDFSELKGKDVTVVGAGQAALETAALAHEAGASARLLVRASSIVWNPLRKLAPRSLYQRLRRPRTRFGDGLGHWVYDNWAGVFRYLPRSIRLKRVRTALGPAGARWLRDRIEGKVPVMLGQNIRRAEARGGKVVLTLVDPNGKVQELTTDHMIAATGYKFDLRKLPFLDAKLKAQLRHEEYAPRLSPNFESSVKGLYFTSLGSANSFGPAMRFLAGADYTARRISKHVARSLRVAVRPFAPSEKCREFPNKVLHAR